MNLPSPLKGVSDILASGEQAELTSRDILNMRPTDPTNDRARLAQRSGQSPYMADTLAADLTTTPHTQRAEPIKALDQVTYQRKTVDYEPKVDESAGVGAQTVLTDTADDDWATATPSKRQVPAIKVDRQGNVYAIDGFAGVVKYNSKGQIQWKTSLPATSADAQVRALDIATVGFIDAPLGGDAIFTGVSTGGAQSDAAMWCHKQVNTQTSTGSVEVKTEMVWEFKPGAFIEMVEVRDGMLYTAQNEPDKGRAYVRVYDNLTTAQPDLRQWWEVPYPVNSIDVKTDDGSVLTAHEPNPSRGVDPRNPGFSARDLAQEWTLADLTDLDKRLWVDLDASTIAATLELEDGDAVSAWPDDGPSFRSLYQATAANQPTYVENGIGGLPAIRFTGTASSLLTSLVNPSISKQFDDQQKTLTPNYTGNRWAMFIVMRPANEDTIRPAFNQDNTASGALTDGNTLCINKNSTTAVSTTGTFNGKACWLTTTDATYPGFGTGVGVPVAADLIQNDSTGAVILSIIHDGSANGTDDEAQHSTFRCNGRPLDRWVSEESTGLTASTIGGPGLSALATYLQGDISRIIVLREYPDGGAQGDPITGAYTTVGGTGDFHYPRTIGAAGASAAISHEAIAGNRYNDNELERIEGWLAGIYGLAHTLPCGTAARLNFSTATVADTETITIDGVVYTWEATASPPNPYQVYIGASNTDAATNLFRAINGTGTPGTDYGVGTLPHPTVKATYINVVTGASATANIKIETKWLTAVAVTSTTANAVWNATPTAALATSLAATTTYCPGHYPHPFNINYGFPRKDTGSTIGVTLESKGKMLTSKQGILARWASNGKIKWVHTSRRAALQPFTSGSTYLPAADVFQGGLGYACAFGTTTGVYSYGPWSTALVQGVFGSYNATITSGQYVVGLASGCVILLTAFSGGGLTFTGEVLKGTPIAGETLRIGNVAGTGEAVGISFVDWGTGGAPVRAIALRDVDLAESVLTPAPAAGTGTWYVTAVDLTATVDADELSPDYHYPRIAVDTFDKLYLPYWTAADIAATQRTLVCVGSPQSPAVGFEVQYGYLAGSGATALGGLCVAIDPKLPDYQGDPVKIAFACYVGTRLGNTTETASASTLHRLEAVTATSNGDSPRTTKYVGVSYGYVRTFTDAGPADPGGTDSLSQPVLTAGAQFVSTAVLFGDVFITDGRRDVVYKARADKTEVWKSTTAGEMKPRARILCAWRGRMIRARFADDAHEFMMSAQGNPYDYDIAPPTPSSTQAVLGTQTTGFGKCPDIINSICPYSDDLAIFFCQSSIYRMDGDPADGGQFSLITDSTGGSFGNCWCKDENGVVYFHSPRGAVYRLIPGRQPEDLSESAIPNRLRSVNLETHRVELRWNDVDSGFHVFVIPYDEGDVASVEHYFWSRKVEGWFPDKIGLASIQPMSSLTIDGDAVGNRRMILGCADGIVRVWDSAARDDDGTAIDAHVLIGPLRPKQDEFETRFTRLQVVLAHAQDGCGYSFYATDTPDLLGDAVYHGTLVAGRNHNEPVRALGSYVALMLGNAAPSERFAIENIEVDAVSAGRKRVRQ